MRLHSGLQKSVTSGAKHTNLASISTSMRHAIRLDAPAPTWRHECDSSKAAEMTDPRVCETHGTRIANVVAALADALGDGAFKKHR